MRVVHFKKEPYTQYIGRPSQFGNPYSLDKYPRAEAIELYEEYARKESNLLEAIKQLPEDSVLGCWCAPRPCHGDVIIKLWKELHAKTME